MGGIILFYTLFSGYFKTFKFLLQLGMVTMCFLEMWLRIPAIKEDSNLSSEIKAILIKKQNKIFILFCQFSLWCYACLFLFIFVTK